MTLKTLMQGPLPVTAPLVLNPLMAKMVEASGFSAGYLGGGATGYLKVVLEANLNVSEMCQAALDIRAVSSLPLILDGACGYGDPMHMHRTIGMAEAAGFAAIEIEDQLVPNRAHHPVRIAHMTPLALMAARLGAPLMYLTGRGGLAALGMSLKDLGALGYRIVADPSTPLWAGYAAWKKVYADLADDFGAKAQKTDWTAVEHEVLGVIDI